MLLKRGTGNGEWGMGNWEWGMGNGEWGMGNGERGTGNGEWGTGNGEWGMGKAYQYVERESRYLFLPLFPAVFKKNISVFSFFFLELVIS